MRKISLITLIIFLVSSLVSTVFAGSVDKQGFRRSANLTTGQVTCGTTATAIFATPNLMRTGVMFLNNSGGSVYLGEDATVTSANGFIYPNNTYPSTFGDNIHPYTGTWYCIAVTTPRLISYMYWSW